MLSEAIFCPLTHFNIKDIELYSKTKNERIWGSEGLFSLIPLNFLELNQRIYQILA